MSKSQIYRKLRNNFIPLNFLTVIVFISLFIVMLVVVPLSLALLCNLFTKSIVGFVLTFILFGVIIVGIAGVNYALIILSKKLAYNKLIKKLLLIKYNEPFAVRDLKKLYNDEARCVGYRFKFYDADRDKFSGKVYVFDEKLRTNYKR